MLGQRRNQPDAEALGCAAGLLAGLALVEAQVRIA
jgi:hypothetical protein